MRPPRPVVARASELGVAARAAAALVAALALGACGDDAAETPTADTAADDDAADVVEVDTGPDGFIPPLERVSKITFRLGGVAQTFDVGGRADYVVNDKQLKISANRGTRKLEIDILPIEPLVVGTWESGATSEVGVRLCYNDGSGQVQLSQCAIGFTHESTAYALTLTQNDGPGEFVEGTFSATLASPDGSVLELTEGVIEVRHR